LFTNHLEDELISARGVDKSGKLSLRDLRAAKSGGKVGQTKLQVSPLGVWMMVAVVVAALVVTPKPYWLS